MATTGTVGGVLIEKETSHTSVNTYYKATLASTPTHNGTSGSFTINLTITLGSVTGLDSGSTRTRTVYVYNSSGTLIGSQLIKDSNTSWNGNSTYTYSISCTDTIDSSVTTKEGYYIRILYSTSSNYGGTKSCYWTGSKSTNGGTVGQTFGIIYSEAIYTNKINHFLSGFVNGEGNNGGTNTFYKFDETSYQASAGDTITLSASMSITPPNGTVFNSAVYGSNHTGAYTEYAMGTSYSQPAFNNVNNLFYRPVTYTITYNLNGGQNNVTNPSSYNILYGVSLAAPTKDGYVFSHWTDANGNIVTGINVGANAYFNNGNDLVNKLASRTTGNQTLTAHWVSVGDSGLRIKYNGELKRVRLYIGHNGEIKPLTLYVGTPTGVAKKIKE